MSTGISDMTEIELYCHRTESLWVTVWAEIKDGKLTVQGQDLGGTVGAWFGGSDEFEYSCSFDEMNTRKLFSILSENGSDPVKEFVERFSGSHGFWELKDFCDNENIPYTYFSWHSHD